VGRVVVGGKLAERARIRRGRTGHTRVLPLIKEQALAEFGPDEDRDPFVIHPSEMAKADWCHRATYWRITGRPQPEEKFNWVLETIFAAGNDAHEKYQRWMRATGKLYGAWQCLACQLWWTGVSGELPEQGCYGFADRPLLAHVWAYREVRMRPEGSLIAGRADGGIDDTLVECKTIGVGTLRTEAPTQLKRYYNTDAKLYDLDKLWRELARPYPSHVRQANIYLWLSAQLGLPFTQMAFIYEFKPNQQTKEFSITPSAAILDPLLAKAREVERAVAAGVPPDCLVEDCKQCRAYEEEPSAGAPETGGTRPDGKARRVVTGSRSRSGEAGPDAAPPPRRRAAAGAAGPDRPGRPGADGAVRPAEPVGRISRRSVGGGRSGRVVRQQAGRQADRAGPDPGEG
jgi:hypothetical protein